MTSHDALAPDGPALLPLRWGMRETPFTLWHFEFGSDRWIAAYTGAIDDGEPVPLRIESACVFGHVLRSAQCDCGQQLDDAMRLFARHGRGLLLYGVDQDARGLGIAAHFEIYAMRQRENLDTDAVYQRLDAPLDARSYEPVAAILRHLSVSSIRLLSNNPRRTAFLRERGFEVVTEPHEVPLDEHNMSTLMLEKEDLGYLWSFETHADWLEPLQEAVAHDADASRACAAIPGGGTTDHPLAEAADEGEGDLALRLADAMPVDRGDGVLVVYLSDLPRADDLALYADLGVVTVVVPFADIPAPLRAVASTLGLRLVDWERRNAYREPRPQWRLVRRVPAADVYVRECVVRCLVPLAGVAPAAAEAILEDIGRACGEATEWLGKPADIGGGASARWLHLRAAPTPEAAIALADRLADLAAKFDQPDGTS